MNTLTTRWMTALVLSSIALAGCGGRPEAHTENPAQAPAAPPVALLPDPGTAPAPTAAPPSTQPAPAPQAAASPAPQAPSGARTTAPAQPVKLKVRRLVIAQGVQNREPVEPGNAFRAADTDRIYAFVELENEAQADSEVTVAFIPPGGGAPIGNVSLDVGPHPRWRTWAYTRGARKAGEWTAVVRSPSGEVLARTPFEITL